MTQGLSWERAILQVLGHSNEPMHYKDITEEILSGELLSTSGKTPSATVRNAIYRMIERGEPILRIGPGIYCLSGSLEVPETIPETSIAEDSEFLAASSSISVAAYGLNWERDKVDWTSGRILGYDTDPRQPIDFSDQQGVYLLHNWQSTVYVGRTEAERNGLSQRLRHHHRRSDWSGKWERFSWFGLRRVDDAGNIFDGPDTAAKDTVVALMETLLIEVLGPALNRNQGDYRGTLYRQAIDPNVARELALDILRALPR